MCAIGESPRDPAPGVEPGGHEQSSIVPEGPMSTAELAGVDKKILGEKVCSLDKHRDEIIGALDFLLTGF